MQADYISRNSWQTKDLGYQIAKQLSGGEVLCLFGEMGAGKTKFISGVINFFLPGKRVLSPTFLIVRHYQLAQYSIKNLYHVDLYRIGNNYDLEGIGIAEFIQKPDTIVAIEWAERLSGIKPLRRMDITFSILTNNLRKIRLKTYGRY